MLLLELLLLELLLLLVGYGNAMLEGGGPEATRPGRMASSWGSRDGMGGAL